MNPKEVLDERYMLVRRIGVGGMGSVWQAREIASGRFVAIKALHEHLVEETELVARFLREAQAALEARYSGHIIEVYDVVQPQDNPPYMVMEYLKGEDLEQILEREGPFEPRRAVDLIIQACQAVAEVHRQGLIHRDIKPENLFVTRLKDGTEWIKLLDFGVVKFSESESDRVRPLTDFGRTVGTVWYMAPEQASNPGSIDHRVDVYATGVVLYELLSGEVPFDSDDQRELMRMLHKGRPPSIRKKRPEISDKLEKIVLKALSVSRRKRFQTMYELAEALEPLSSSVPRQTAQRNQVQPKKKLDFLSNIFRRRASETIEIDPSEYYRHRRRRALLIGGIAIAVALLVVGMSLLIARSCASPTTEAKDLSDEPILVVSQDASASDGGRADGAVEGGTPDDEETQRRWQARYGKRLNKRAVAKGLRLLNPVIRPCLKGTRAPGTRVLMHFWIASNGVIQYRRSRPKLSRSAEACIRRGTRRKRLAPTKVPPFVATQTFVVP